MRLRNLENSFVSAFCLEISMLFEAGIAPADGILMLKDDEPSQDGKAVMQAILDSLEDGDTMYTALQKSGYFPRYMVSMVEIGEKTGRLSSTLRALSEYYDRQDRLSLAIKNAVLYPMILLIMMVAVVIILITQVLPLFNETFNRMGVQMSPLATGFMQFGMWLADFSTVIAIIFGVIITGVIVIWLAPSLRASFVDGIKRLWGHRGILGDIASARFISAMALTTASGMDTEEALNMAASVSGGSKNVNEMHRQCVELLHAGNSLADAMHRAGIISARDNRMLTLGTRSGMSDAAMTEIATRNDRNVQDKIDAILSRLEPTLVIISSVLVGVILLSVMMPLMGIMTSIE